MTQFYEFFTARLASGGFSTEDALASFLPLVRQTLEVHGSGQTAPLEGLDALQIEGVRIWFPSDRRQPVRNRLDDVERFNDPRALAVEILSEGGRTHDVDQGVVEATRHDVDLGLGSATRPAFRTGYVSWEHTLGHHDALTDTFSLGLILASLALGVDFNDPDDVEKFATHRRNPFAIQPAVHPVLARAIVQMTELDRRRRPHDLRALLTSLENYRDQRADFEFDLAREQGFAQQPSGSKQRVVLEKLRQRLFDLSRRNTLLNFRATNATLNLTQASVPLSFDVANVRADQIMVWNADLQGQLKEARPVSLNARLNFSEALYVPPTLDRIMADARRDQAEYGFAQLRLVVCFLAWANVKEPGQDRFYSPLVLLPVRAFKSKGVKDTYFLEAQSVDAEVNPVLRHQFRQLYGIELPEAVDLASQSIEELFELLDRQIRASEPAVRLTKIDRPRIDLLHEKARRRLDQFRRSARLAGKGVRSYRHIQYSYDPANYHPLGLKLFQQRVCCTDLHLRTFVEDRPRPRAFAAPPEPSVVETERQTFSLRQASEENPYQWNFDLCNLTLANFHYRKMSLVRDYDTAIRDEPHSAGFDAVFSLTPRPSPPEAAAQLPLEDRFHVVACDPTQGSAIAVARRGESYIIQGPPGTGKSQTITNLIADFVAQGKRVLFVCEKRAAIDVVHARLRQCGLGPLCCLIHDSQTDKKAFVLDLKQAYEELLGVQQETTDSGRSAAMRGLLTDLNPLEAFGQAMLSEPEETGCSVRAVLDRRIALAADVPAPPREWQQRLPSYSAWQSHREQIAAFCEALAEIEPSGVLANHPFRYLRHTLADEDRPVEFAARTLDQARQALDELTGALQRSGVSREHWQLLTAARQLADYGNRLEWLAAQGGLALADPRSSASRKCQELCRQHAEESRELAAAITANAVWKFKLAPADTRLALSQAKDFEQRWAPWLSPSWWRLRGVLQRAYDFRRHVVRPTWSQILAGLEHEYAVTEQVQQIENRIADQFPALGRGTANLNRLGETLEYLTGLPAWLKEIHRQLVASDDSTSIAALAEAARPARQLDQALSAALHIEDQATLDDLSDELDNILERLDTLPDFLTCLSCLSKLPQEVQAALRSLPYTGAQLESAAAEASLERIYRRDRALARFNQTTRARHVARLERAHKLWLKTNAQEILDRVHQRFRQHVSISNSPAAQLTTEQKELKKQYAKGRRELENEFSKSIRFKAIRELLSGETGLVIQDLKPVWLMSPLSVSDTLPLDTQALDVVIFDEASQIPLEEAVPAVFRGGQVIIVGDEMQLPPTDFFSSRATDDDPVTFQEAGEVVRYELESDSLLNHAAKNLPSTMLGWHYRSRSESLISFSNWSFYDGRLLTVPEEVVAAPDRGPVAITAVESAQQTWSALIQRPLSFHYLPFGVYQSQRNRAEAEYIAELVRALLMHGQRQTIGVIAFSEAQQGEIETALDRLAADDADFRARLDAELDREDDGQFCGLLVKNLENIQGDERDVIILSVCYGRGPDGKMRMNFGPINRSGGEKRLNVAFSRAKQAMAVVSSIHHHDITNDYNDGANSLKNYLRYAEACSAGDQEAAAKVLKSRSRWTHATAADQPGSADAATHSIASALRARGYGVDMNVGQSRFHVPLAVRYPGEEKYRLGVLVDTETHYRQPDVLEREMMLPRLLTDFGWSVVSVLAKDWAADPHGVLLRILQRLEGGKEPEQPDAEDDSDLVRDTAEASDIATAAAEPESPAPSNAVLARAECELEDVTTATPAGHAPTTVSNLLPIDASPNTVRLEYRKGNSAKFWEITVTGDSHRVRFGRIGTKGQTIEKAFKSAAAAHTDAQRLIREKTAKGYANVLSG